MSSFQGGKISLSKKRQKEMSDARMWVEEETSGTPHREVD
jgi:hypothetical protein